MQAPDAHYAAPVDWQHGAPAANPNVISGTNLFGVVEGGQVVGAQEFMRTYVDVC